MAGRTAGGRPVSVIVRARDAERRLPAIVESIRAQNVAAELVAVVDLASVDGTLRVAQSLSDVVVPLPAGTFSYGRALNMGAQAASQPVHAALSAHTPYPRRDWLEIAVRHVEDGAAAAFGSLVDGDLQPLDGPRRLDHRYLVAHRAWGMSNHASAWSAESWREHRFDETLLASEDREWTWRATEGGGYVVVDPALDVPHSTRHGRGYVTKRIQEVRAGIRLGIEEPMSLRLAWRLLSAAPPDGVPDWLRTRRFGRQRAREAAAVLAATLLEQRSRKAEDRATHHVDQSDSAPGPR